MFGLLLTFLLALVVSVVATFFVRDLGFRLDLVDRPDGVRKMHHASIPRVGGMAVLAGTVLAIIVPVLAGFEPGWAVRTIPTGVLPLGIAGLVIFCLGLADDFMDLNARLKFGVEGVVAAGLFVAGLRIGTVSVGPDFLVEMPVVLDFVITVMWFVGMSNAFNLIDGHDGVAGGVALLALATISYAAVLNGNSVVAIPALALSGSVLGFLLFNLPPASVFLGDAGSLFLGFTLAGLALIGARPDLGGAVPIMVPILALGLPVLDTSLAVFRRFLRGDPVFSADRGHIHHRLRDRGYPKPVVTLFMWGISGMFALMAVMLMAQDALLTGVGVTLAISLSLVAIRWLETPEIMELGRAVQRAVVQRRAIRPNVFLRGAVDLLQDVRDARGLDRALRHAFQDSRADLVEVWVPSNWEGVLTDHEAFHKESFGVSWKLGEEDPAEIWEISVALELSSPKVGRLSLRFVDPSPDSLAHVDSVVRKLRPALCATLDRLLPPDDRDGRERSEEDASRDEEGSGRA